MNIELTNLQIETLEKVLAIEEDKLLTRLERNVDAEENIIARLNVVREIFNAIYLGKDESKDNKNKKVGIVISDEAEEYLETLTFREMLEELDTNVEETIMKFKDDFIQAQEDGELEDIVKIFLEATDDMLIKEDLGCTLDVEGSVEEFINYLEENEIIGLEHPFDFDFIDWIEEMEEKFELPFEIDDRVRIVKDKNAEHLELIGKEGEVVNIIKVGDTYFYEVELLIGGKALAEEEELELI